MANRNQAGDRTEHDRLPGGEIDKPLEEREPVNQGGSDLPGGGGPGAARDSREERIALAAARRAERAARHRDLAPGTPDGGAGGAGKPKP